IAALRADQAGMVRTVGVRRQESAAMGRDHLQPGKAIEGAFKDQMRERNRRLQRVADRVDEPAIAREALVEFGYTLRMNEQRHAEFFSLGPYRMEFRVGE